MTYGSKNKNNANTSRRSTSDNKCTNSAYYRKMSSRQRGAHQDNKSNGHSNSKNRSKLAPPTEVQHNFNRHKSATNIRMNDNSGNNGTGFKNSFGRVKVSKDRSDANLNQFWQKKDDLVFDVQKRNN